MYVSRSRRHARSLTQAHWQQPPAVTVASRTCLVTSDLLVVGITWAKTYGIVRFAHQQGFRSTFSLPTVLLRDGQSSVQLNCLVRGSFLTSCCRIGIFRVSSKDCLITLPLIRHSVWALLNAMHIAGTFIPVSTRLNASYNAALTLPPPQSIGYVTVFTDGYAQSALL